MIKMHIASVAWCGWLAMVAMAIGRSVGGSLARVGGQQPGDDSVFSAGG